MGKKNVSFSIDSINLPRRLREGLQEADNLLDDNEPQQALEILHELDKKFPRQTDVLDLIANAYVDLGDDKGYLHTLLELHSLTPNRAEIKLGLAGGYLATSRFALALQTFRQFVQKWPRHERAAEVHRTILELEKIVAKILAEFGMTVEGEWDFVCKHEELQILMERGQYERCKQIAKLLLAQRPDFAPTLNNLSEVYWLEGEISLAIQTAQKTLAIQNDNIHALANLARFFFAIQKTAEAHEYAAELKTSRAYAADFWTKKFEALGFIADDDGVLAMLEQAKQAKEQAKLNAYVWHWCAVAEYRKGNTAKARSYWQKSQKLLPTFSLAQDNLDELKKPVYERLCPQVFSMDVWLSHRVMHGLSTVVQRAAGQKNDQAFSKKTREYLDQHPEIFGFVEAALPWGDGLAREFALQLGEISEHPRLLNILKDFALDEIGPDSQRLKVAQTLSKLGVLESGEEVELWMGGERKPIMMLGFYISYEADKKPTLKPAAIRLLAQANDALHADQAPKAEGLLRKALEMQPNDPSLLNNLAVALDRQGKRDEAKALADRVVNEFTDYFFGHIIAIRRALHKDDLEIAKAILHRLLKRKEFHVTEFSAMCACQIDLMIADNKPEGAISWFKMWKDGYPDDPRLDDYEDNMNLFEAFAKVKEFASRPRRKGKRS